MPVLAACQSGGNLRESVTGLFRESQPAQPRIVPPPAAPTLASGPPIRAEPLPADVPASAAPQPALRVDAIPAAPVPASQSDVRMMPRVALLLPLSGANAAVGQALLDAATQAVFDVADDDFVLLVRDTEP